MINSNAARQDKTHRSGSIIHDSRFLLHQGPALHPESPQRLNAIYEALQKSGVLAELTPIEPRIATDDELLTVHNAAYIEHLKQESELCRSQQQIKILDPDTFLCPESYNIAKLAVGGCLAGIDSLLEPENEFSFSLVRPPGHHARPHTAMGFCLLNNIAVAARYAQHKLAAKRIFILDWDVHHGNGTQDIFYADPSVLFLSLHQFPIYPGSGWYTEIGDGEGKGYNLNVPLPAGTGDAGYLKVWKEIIEPVFNEYAPDLIMVSAGYDAHELDQLANQQVSTRGFGIMAQKLLQLARSRKIKIFATLEGGYHLNALPESVLATISAFQGKQETSADETSPSKAASAHNSSGADASSPGNEQGALTADLNPDEVAQRVDEVRNQNRPFWKSLK